jgi:hypothetical protein
MDKYLELSTLICTFAAEKVKQAYEEVHDDGHTLKFNSFYKQLYP